MFERYRRIIVRVYGSVKEVTTIFWNRGRCKRSLSAPHDPCLRNCYNTGVRFVSRSTISYYYFGYVYIYIYIYTHVYIIRCVSTVNIWVQTTLISPSQRELTAVNSICVIETAERQKPLFKGHSSRSEVRASRSFAPTRNNTICTRAAPIDQRRTQRHVVVGTRYTHTSLYRQYSLGRACV